MRHFRTVCAFAHSGKGHLDRDSPIILNWATGAFAALCRHVHMGRGSDRPFPDQARAAPKRAALIAVSECGRDGFVVIERHHLLHALDVPGGPNQVQMVLGQGARQPAPWAWAIDAAISASSPHDPGMNRRRTSATSTGWRAALARRPTSPAIVATGMSWIAIGRDQRVGTDEVDHRAVVDAEILLAGAGRDMLAQDMESGGRLGQLERLPDRTSSLPPLLSASRAMA